MTDLTSLKPVSVKTRLLRLLQGLAKDVVEEEDTDLFDMDKPQDVAVYAVLLQAFEEVMDEYDQDDFFGTEGYEQRYGLD